MKPLLVVAALLAAGCTRLPDVSDGLDFAQRASHLRALADWTMRGRLSIDTGEQTHGARFRWLQSGQDQTLVISGPLNVGGVRIAGDREQLTVLARGDERVLSDPENELSAMLGWWLPVTSLPDWLRGLPDTRFAADTDFGTAGTLRRLAQREWVVDYAEYQLRDGVLMPRRAVFAHESLRLEMLVDDWQTSGASEAAATLN